MPLEPGLFLVTPSPQELASILANPPADNLRVGEAEHDLRESSGLDFRLIPLKANSNPGDSWELIIALGHQMRRGYLEITDMEDDHGEGGVLISCLCVYTSDAEIMTREDLVVSHSKHDGQQFISSEISHNAEMLETLIQEMRP